MRTFLIAAAAAVMAACGATTASATVLSKPVQPVAAAAPSDSMLQRVGDHRWRHYGSRPWGWHDHRAYGWHDQRAYREWRRDQRRWERAQRRAWDRHWDRGHYTYRRHHDGDDAAWAALAGGVVGFALGQALDGPDHRYGYGYAPPTRWCYDRWGRAFVC